MLMEFVMLSSFSPTSSTTKTGRRDIAESDVRHQKFKFKINNERKNTKL
jgi:hypothetical protein